MTPILLMIRALLWLFFILPICAVLAIRKGDPAAALIVAVVLGTLARLATRTPDETE